MQGIRLADGVMERDPFKPGTYGRREIGAQQRHWIWVCTTPNGHHGNLAAHQVVEHEDGTITVSPSILIREGRDGVDHEVWHGYLEHGVWREC